MARSSEQAILKALKKDHLETLRRKDALHSAELEKKRRLEWRAHQQQVRLAVSNSCSGRVALEVGLVQLSNTFK